MTDLFNIVDLNHQTGIHPDMTIILYEVIFISKGHLRSNKIFRSGKTKSTDDATESYSRKQKTTITESFLSRKSKTNQPIRIDQLY